MQPHALSVQLLRHLICRLEPVMAVFSIPVHVLAVKVLPRRSICLGFLRTDKIALLVFPVVDFKFLLHL